MFLEARSNYVNPRVPGRTVRELAPGELPANGAHLITPWLGFAHHGIYAGEGKVVHYGALMYDIIRKPVEEVTLEQFAEGRPVFVVEHGDECVAAAEAIRRARSRLGEKRYRLLTNNCEHFVEWCLHGVHRSFQAETALAYPRMLSEWFRDAALRVFQRAFAPRRLTCNPSTATRALPAASVREPRDRSGRHSG
jgi:Lecithin retinol acyltransferase